MKFRSPFSAFALSVAFRVLLMPIMAAQAPAEGEVAAPRAGETPLIEPASPASEDEGTERRLPATAFSALRRLAGAWRESQEEQASVAPAPSSAADIDEGHAEGGGGIEVEDGAAVIAESEPAPLVVVVEPAEEEPDPTELGARPMVVEDEVSRPSEGEVVAEIPVMEEAGPPVVDDEEPAALLAQAAEPDLDEWVDGEASGLVRPPESGSGPGPRERRPEGQAASSEGGGVALHPVRGSYRLGPGDQLNFGLHGKPSLTRKAVPVGPDGTVSYLQARQVTAAGRTLPALKAELEKLLANYHRNPKVILTPARLESKRYTILGEVRRNGAYPLDQQVTLVQALARAGGVVLGADGNGVTELADLQRSFVVREGARLPVDMEALYLRGDLEQDVPLKAGDYIYVASRVRNEVYVFGAVREPGMKAMPSGRTTLAAIAAAGGFGQAAWRDRVLVVRGRLDQPEGFIVPLNDVIRGRNPDFELHPGDIIYVSRRPWAVAVQVMDQALQAYIDGTVAGWVADGDIAVSAAF